MKRLVFILTVFGSLFSMSLTASERVELPTKSISSILNEDLPNSRRVISIVQLVQPVDSTENQGKTIRIATGVVEIIVGCVIVVYGCTAMLYGSVIYLFRPEDRREWIVMLSAGTAGTALGLVVIDDGVRRMGFRGIF